MKPIFGPRSPQDTIGTLTRRPQLPLPSEASDLDHHDDTGRRKHFCFMPMPTPDGVPMAVASPGTILMNWDI